MYDTDSTDVVIALSDPARFYFRHEVLPTYKHNRTHGRPPAELMAVKDHLAEKYPSYVRPRLEADDILGILATNPKLVKGETIIVTADKDLRQIPGLHYDIRTDKLVEVTEREGERLFFLQALMGDPTDGFKGCPGIGPKRAEALLAHIDPRKTRQAWGTVVRAYELKGLTEADALVQARVARILRHGEYDYANKEPILWTPSS